MSTELETLSDGQKQVLRLVLTGLKSAAIAAELGISEHTVDQRCRVVNRKLGTTDRFAAARMLAAHEGIAPYQQLIYQTPYIPNEAETAPIDALPGFQAAGSSAEHRFEVRDAQAPYAPGFSIPEAISDTRTSVSRNGLTTRERLHHIAVTAVQFATAVCLVMLLLLLVTLVRQRS